MTITYIGVRTEAGGVSVHKQHEDGRLEDLDPRLDVRNHSPTGFEWGYAGSGPAQLALALLTDALGDEERAKSLYQRAREIEGIEEGI